MRDGRVLVTGADGFVGRHLVRAFGEAGRALTLATRARRERRVGSEPRVVAVGDVCGTTEWSDALEGVACVVHLAAHVHVAPETAEREAGLFERVNHLGAVRLFVEAARCGVARFVHLSTVNVLGVETTGVPFRDDSPTNVGTPYARSKLAAERALVDLARLGGPSLTILRPPLICGPGVGGNLDALLRLAASPWPLPLGGIDNRRTLLSVENLVSAIGAILDRSVPAPGTYLLGDREPISTSAIVESLRAGMGRPPRLFRIPRGLAAASGRSGIVRRLFGDLEIESGRFRRDLGWEDVIDTPTALRRLGAGRHEAGGPMSAHGRTAADAAT